jgi:hypothetical protein
MCCGAKMYVKYYIKAVAKKVSRYLRFSEVTRILACFFKFSKNFVTFPLKIYVSPKVKNCVIVVFS